MAFAVKKKKLKKRAEYEFGEECVEKLGWKGKKTKRGRLKKERRRRDEFLRKREGRKVTAKGGGHRFTT
jgi:hypothetical protein